MGKRPKLTAEQLEKMCQLRRKSWPTAAIAKETGYSQQYVDWLLLREGVDAPANKAKAPPPVPLVEIVYFRCGRAVRRFNFEEDQRLLALEAEGMTLAHIARALGRTRNAVQGRLLTLARHEARQEARLAQQGRNQPPMELEAHG